MIRCEHFVYGQFNGIGYRLIKSKGVDDIVHEKDLEYLCRLDGVDPTFTWLHNTKHVAVTYFGRTIDEYQRSTRWTHTILIFIGDFFKFCDTKAFDLHFIKETDVRPRNLKPLVIEETT